MNLASSLSKLARSSQGRKLTQKAMQYAQSPEGQRKIAQAREAVTKRKKPSA
jgi:hypothetical protein